MDEYSSVENSGSKKKLIIIIAVVVLVLVAAVIGGLYYWRSRGSGGTADIGGASPSPQQQAALHIRANADKKTAVAIAVPTDPASGKPVPGEAKEMSVAEKTALGIAAGSTATITIKQMEASPVMVSEITVVTPAAAGAAGDGAGPTTVTTTIALPTAAAGKVSTNVVKELTGAEKSSLGLPAAAKASIVVRPAADGGLVTEFQVEPVSADDMDDTTDTGAEAGVEPVDPAASTAAPSGCGDYACQENESAASCPSDCVLASESEIQGRMGWRVIDDKTIGIEWTTNIPTSGAVDYGHTTGYELGSVQDEQAANAHALRLGGINIREAVLYYRIRVMAADGTAKTIVGENGLNEFRQALGLE
jgi:flagellar basal body-associated protein FliL